MSEGYFRKKKGFTVVQNRLVRDKNVSLKAKGLYLVIQSNITIQDVNWKKSDFINMSTEGRKAFDSAWNELKRNGYLHVHIYPDGNTFRTEYELLDEPDRSAHTYYYNKDGILTMTNVDRIPQNGYNGNGVHGNGANGDGMYGNGDNNNKDLNINTSDKDLYTKLSINQSKDMKEADKKLVLDEIESYKEIIRDNIEYDSVMKMKNSGDAELYDEVYQVICDIVCVPRKTVRINREDYPYELVRSRFLKLNYSHIEYVLERMDKVGGEIENIRSYIVTALYNAPETMKNYYKMQVQKDMMR